MFTTSRVNVIESDEGFSVEVLGRAGLRYYEGDKVLDVDSEIGEHPYEVIYADSISRWKPPHEKEVIDKPKRFQIIQNIRRAFQSQGLDIGVIDPTLPRTRYKPE
jgi:hypothetical protein